MGVGRLGYNLRMTAAGLILGQTDAAEPGLWTVLLDNALALTVLFIFLTAIVSLLLKARRKDKCLKLLQGSHVAYLTTAGQAIWGDLRVYSLGLELTYDAP